MKTYRNFVTEAKKENPYDKKKEPDLFGAWEKGYNSAANKKKMPSYPDRDYEMAWKAGLAAAKTGA